MISSGSPKAPEKLKQSYAGPPFNWMRKGLLGSYVSEVLCSSMFAYDTLLCRLTPPPCYAPTGGEVQLSPVVMEGEH